MITPTVGRVIWFQPAITEGQERLSQPWPALVTFVHDDNTVNVAGFTADGAHFAAQAVHLLQDDEDSHPQDAFTEWMPYQKSQAASQPMTAAQGQPY